MVLLWCLKKPDGEGYVKLISLYEIEKFHNRVAYTTLGLRAQQQYLSSPAYRLFSKGKTPVQVSIELSLRQPDVTILYAEYCKLSQHLSRIYGELKDDIEPFLKLYWLTKAAGVSVQ